MKSLLPVAVELIWYPDSDFSYALCYRQAPSPARQSTLDEAHSSFKAID